MTARILTIAALLAALALLASCMLPEADTIYPDDDDDSAEEVA